MGTKNAKELKVNREDFATIAICALRYSMGRRTYMPRLVQSIVRPFLPEMSDKDLHVLQDDLHRQKEMGNYGDPCDKEEWLRFASEVNAEAARRKTEKENAQEKA